jgi:DNA end-binding protein Ku
MARALWTGYVSFGLVSIPVALVPAVHDQGVHFHLLHRKDGARLKQRLVCPVDGEVIERKEAARGFEVAPDQYVLVEDDELRALEPGKTRMIEISDFVDVSQIDPIYYNKPYYLVPREGGGRAYSLLMRAMRERNRVGVGRFVFHEHEYVVALRPLENVLCVETLRFAEEIVGRDDLGDAGGDESRADDKQLALALELVDALASDFEPGKYREEYRDGVRELIEKKARGEEIVAAPAEFEEGKVIDLMAALEKSLDKVRGAGGKGRAGKQAAAGKRARV